MKVVLVLSYFALLCALTWRRTQVWQDNVSLWSDAVKTAPCSSRAHGNLAMALPADSDASVSEWQATALIALGEMPKCVSR